MSFIQVVYQSQASQPLAEEEILDILRKSQSQNQRRRISGMLFYWDGCFLQLIEGPEAAVENLLTTISQDTRHHDIRVVERSTAGSLSMPTWAMGFFAPGLEPRLLKDEFILDAAETRAISELLPEHIGRHFIALLDHGSTQP